VGTLATCMDATSSGSEGRYVEEAEDFADAVDSAEEEQRRLLRRLHDWAVFLDREGLVRLGTDHAKGGDMMSLLPRLRADNAGLVTIYRYSGTASLQFWRSVFERRVPESLNRIEQAASVPVGQGNTTAEVSDELLEALTDAYREAVSGRIG
jgi:hypothetical protein